jgi:hypothetical protein
MTILWRYLILISSLWACGGQRPVFEPLNYVSDVSVVITMICRNEAVNFRSNLKLWFPVVDYFTFLMDSRNSDDSEEVIDMILKEGKKQYMIEKHEFGGFGQARTASLDAAWRHFPTATHVIIADPDWRPRVDTLHLAQLIAANAEVFRFTVYDRNKVTTRRIDWMLRHRQGLAMRYHLHEVLDIGYYTWTDTTWEVDEIEQSGTWHNEVGHSTSFAPERYKFDLEMLEKDRVLYQNDPHVDYYLGITHNSYAEKLLESRQAGNIIDNREVQDHYDKAAHHLKLRASGVYAEEFTEQRWGSMLTLATAYEQSEWHGYNRQEAVKWYKLCRDFSPKQFECTAQLIQLYVAMGLTQSAVEDAWQLARTEPEPRAMLNTRGAFNCALPEALLRVFSSHLTLLVSQFGGKPAMGLSKYAKYVVTLANQLLSASECPVAQKAALRSSLTMQASVDAVHQSLAADNVTESVHFVDGDPLTVDLPALCQDPALVEYLVTNEIRVHPCGDIQPSKACIDFSPQFPGIGETRQMAIFGEFIGAASILDLIHEVYAGNGARTVPSGRLFHVLFAQHFNPRMIPKLISFSKAYMDGRLNMTVVHSDAAVLRSLHSTVTECGYDDKVNLDLVHAPSLETWLQAHSESLWSDVDAGRETGGKGFFDYIEYNGGLATSESHHRELSLMRDVLHPDGVLGATYYTTNKIQSSLFDLVDSQNSNANPAFSRESGPIVQSYLRHQGLAPYAEDSALVEFFSRKGEEGPRRVYSGLGVDHMAKSHGYEVAATLPTMASHPFSEASEFYEVAKHKELGTSEDTYLYHFGSALRQTVYLTPRGGLDRPGGRAKVEAVMAVVGEDFQIIDRTGSLGSTFLPEVVQSAVEKQHPVVYGTTSPPPSPFNVSYVIPFSVMPALSTMGSAPSMIALLDTCEEYWNSSQLDLLAPAPPERLRAQVKTDLVHFLGFMERIDLVSFLYNNVPAELQGHREGDLRPSVADPSAALGGVRSSSQPSSESSLLKENLRELLSSTSALDGLATAVSGDVEALKGISEILTEDGSSSSTSSSSSPPTTSSPPTLRSPDIRRPRQTLEQLHASHRRPECSTNSLWRHTDCKVNINSARLGLPVRFSAVPGVVCLRKIYLDHLQMRYIAKKKPQLEEYIMSDGLPGMEIASNLVQQALTDNNLTDQATTLFLNDVAMDAMSGAFNRIFFVSREPMMGNNIPYLEDTAATLLPQAIVRMKSGAQLSTVDELLTEPALAALSSTLMLSTIYFDLTNGQAFVAHDDDGLAFDAFRKASEEISRALPGTSVKKIFAMEMDLRLGGKSPLMMAGEGEVILVLWLSPTSLALNAAKDRENESASDGLVCFPPSAVAALIDSEHKVGFYEEAHTDFLTAFPTELINSFDYPYPSDEYSPQIVRRRVNRATVISQGNPFYLATEAQGEKGSFDEDAVHALVVTLSLEV